MVSSPVKVAKMAASNAVAGVWVAYPATATNYDKDTQTVTIQIVQCMRSKDPKDPSGRTFIKRCSDPISNVPIGFLSGSDSALTMPIADGTIGWYDISDRSISEWKATGNSQTEPQDVRRHDLSDGMWFPAGRSPADPLPAEAVHDTATVLYTLTELLLGDSTATSAVALAPLVEADSTLLKVALAAATSAAIGASLSGDGGLAAFTAFGASLTASLAAYPSSLGASKVKAV